MLSRPATKTRVLIGGADVSGQYHPLSVDLSTGGSRLDTCVLERMQMGQEEDPVADEALVVFAESGQECEVSVQLFDNGQAAGGAATWQVVHWGKLLGHTVAIAGDAQRRGLVSRMEEQHFGVPLAGMPCQNADGELVVIPEDIVFNPEYDGRCVGNRRKTSLAAFVPPEQQLLQHISTSGTEKKTELQGETANGAKVEFWTLAQAVQAICAMCNLAQTHIANPDAKALTALFGADTLVLRNHRLPMGKYLPEQLDRLLRPYGFDWCVDYLSPGKRQIRVFARGRGQPGLVKLQAAGSKLNMSESNAEAINLTADLASRCINSFRVLGDHYFIEATFELVPAWPKDQDDAPDEDLQPPDLDAGGSDSKWLKSGSINTARAWRDFVMNEAGDYNGEREGINKTFDLSPYLGPCVPKRRRFEPTITLGPDGSPIGDTAGITIEYWDVNESDPATGRAGVWVNVSNLSPESRPIKILSHECGIRFDGQLPPSEIRDAGIDEKTQMPKSKIRVTATIRADRRLEATLEDFSALPEAKQETIDAGSRFKKRFIHKSSIYKKKVLQKQLTSTQIDDELALRSFGRQLLANWNQASVAGTLTLTGCGYSPLNALGKPISGVDGRNIDFRTTHSNQESKYPIVVALRYDFAAQTLTAVLDTFRGEVM